MRIIQTLSSKKCLGKNIRLNRFHLFTDVEDISIVLFVLCEKFCFKMIHSFGNNQRCKVKADLKFLFVMLNIPLEICP